MLWKEKNNKKAGSNVVTDGWARLVFDEAAGGNSTEPDPHQTQTLNDHSKSTLDETWWQL